MKNIVWIVMLSFVLIRPAGGDQDERAILLDQEQALHQRIATLKSEQDFLLFQKTMYAADSKYLVLDISKKKGQLKYKNRVLKDFRFTLSMNFSGHAPQPGEQVLTKKEEGANSRYALIFGKSLIIQRKRAAVPPREAKIPFIALTKKEMQSIFLAVEPGAPAYIVK